jgi:hypothetical protein
MILGEYTNWQYSHNTSTENIQSTGIEHILRSPDIMMFFDEILSDNLFLADVINDTF